MIAGNFRNCALGGSMLIAVSAVSAQASAETLTVALYGGLGGEAITACVIEPFQEATGAQVVPDPGTSSVTVTKLHQQTSAPVIDVAWIDGGVSEQALADGLLATLDPERIPNLENLHDAARYEADGDIYAAGTGFYAMGILYDTDAVSEAPTSWQDLWREEFADIVALPAPQNAMGIPIFVHLAEVFGGSIDDVEPAVERLAELEVAAFWDSSGTATNMYQTEEIVIGTHFSSSAWALIEQGLPLAYVVPAEGAVANDIRVHLVEGTPRQELAESFIDMALTPEASACLAERQNMGPSIRGVELEDDVAARMPWGADGSIDDLIIPDWRRINEEREALTQVWNERISRR